MNNVVQQTWVEVQRPALLSSWSLPSDKKAGVLIMYIEPDCHSPELCIELEDEAYDFLGTTTNCQTHACEYFALALKRGYSSDSTGRQERQSFTLSQHFCLIHSQAQPRYMPAQVGMPA
jgi:hypothetical protein